ncbi:MAG: O-antigen ligase family protein [Candidatus Omnitrophica bacterium]|nr:O-antigen ligase family protein [Candidatus Omnitrophota bacterium]
MHREEAVEYLGSFVIEAFLLSLVFFPPLIYGGVTNTPIFLIELISILLVFVFILKCFFKKEFHLIRFPFLPLVLFVCLILFQLLPLPLDFLSVLSPKTGLLFKDFMVNPASNHSLSINPELTVSMLLLFSSYLFIFFTVINYIDTIKKIKRLFVAIIVIGFVVSFYGVVSRFTPAILKFSTFTNRNHFSAYIQMVIPLAISYSLISPLAIRISSLFMASIMTLSLFLSLSRGGIVSFLMSLFLLLLFLSIKIREKRNTFMIIAVVLILAISFGVFSSKHVAQRLETLTHPLKIYSDRLNVIKNSASIIKDFSSFGTGLGTFGEIFQKYKTFESHIEYDVFKFAHNEPVQLLVETGIFGFLLVLIFIFLYFKNIFLKYSRKNNVYLICIILGCLFGLFSITLHSLFDFVFHVPANAVLFCIILALVYRVIYLEDVHSSLDIPYFKIRLPMPIKISLLTALTLTLIFVFSLVLKQYESKIIFDKIINVKIPDKKIDAIIEYRKLIKNISSAIALNPGNSLYLEKKADLLSELVTREDFKDELKNFDEYNSKEKVLFLSEELYKKAIDLNPTNANFHMKLGWLYSELDYKDLSQKEFKKAILLDPMNKKIKNYIDNVLKE